jgi:hypothetical protein
MMHVAGGGAVIAFAREGTWRGACGGRDMVIIL